MHWVQEQRDPCILKNQNRIDYAKRLAVARAVARAVKRAAVTSLAAATGPVLDFLVVFLAGVLLIKDFFVTAIVVSPRLELNFFTQI